MNRLPAVILAGGLATRMRPLTETVPKALIEVAGRPFLWHQLNLLKKNQINEIVILAGYLGEQIQERFGDGSDLGVEISYSFDWPKLLGTAGAIKKALPLLPAEFFVIYGDSYLMCNYGDVKAYFRKSGKQALMTVYRNEGLYDRSNVQFENQTIARYDKSEQTAEMRHIDYGLGMFRRDAFDGLAVDVPHDLAALYKGLLQSNALAGYEVSDRFYEIGSPEGLRDLEKLLSRDRAL